MDDGASRYRVPALTRGLAILEAFAAGQPPATCAELATRLGAPRNSVARLLRALVRQNFLAVDPHGRYQPGPAVARVAAAYVDARPEVVHARPVLQALCERSGLAAQLLCGDGAEAVVLAQVAPDAPACLVTRVGARFVRWPAEATQALGARTIWRLGPYGESRGAAGIVAMPVDAQGALAISVALDAPDDARWRQVPGMIDDAAQWLSRVLAEAAARA
ncbi:IclR family transcriptional regulator [Burkholderia lata]|uniref:helix-turn-helix domain-containing protein n=1 Tax=Burkholderia lata (strain ATCC 17760 / DSM 23089 / LMG 22485 / NCIMB 9086 / R18194 / 383) TaxID=482957 RepID=UPI001452DCC5|nr:helix-turn-helix domain-containing protein [Burkholderia lata]VWB48343.1 IclR family transcriptional regulator [Burkholderia lata]